MLAAGAVFPYKRPEIYEKSPISKRKVLGLPVMTVACTCGFVGAVFYFFTLFFDELRRRSRPLAGWRSWRAASSAGFIFFYIMKAFRKSQGVDVDLAFKQIPIE